MISLTGKNWEITGRSEWLVLKHWARLYNVDLRCKTICGKNNSFLVAVPIENLSDLIDGANDAGFTWQGTGKSDLFFKELRLTFK